MALERYLESRANDVRQSTINDLKTEGKRFLAYVGEEVTLEEVDRSIIYRYLNEHLPKLKTQRCPDGLTRGTIERARTLMAGLWTWARRSGVILYESASPWADQPILMKSKPKPTTAENSQPIFTPEQYRKLIFECDVRVRGTSALEQGPHRKMCWSCDLRRGGNCMRDAMGDATRLALVTGLRLGVQRHCW